MYNDRFTLTNVQLKKNPSVKIFLTDIQQEQAVFQLTGRGRLRARRGGDQGAGGEIPGVQRLFSHPVQIRVASLK